MPSEIHLFIDAQLKIRAAFALIDIPYFRITNKDLLGPFMATHPCMSANTLVGPSANKSLQGQDEAPTQNKLCNKPISYFQYVGYNDTIKVLA